MAAIRTPSELFASSNIRSMGFVAISSGDPVMRAQRQSLSALLGGIGLAVVFTASGSAAPSPVGEWMVAKGEAIIRVVDCGGRYWGLVAWEQKPGGTDARNPDPALRQRTTLGMPILLGMSRSNDPATWSGHIYNSQDGRTYEGHINLAGPNTLHVQGCVLGFLCGGENWQRVSGAAAMAAAGKTGGRSAAAASEPPSRVCSEVLRRH
jgi:uncharacterized protein (DUF2147 family)